MYQHVLLIHSDYSNGKRRALHKCYETIGSIKDFMTLSSQVKEKFKNLTFSFHHLQTMYRSVSSIPEYDKFFIDVEFVSDVEDFISLIEDDTTTKC